MSEEKRMEVKTLQQWADQIAHLLQQIERLDTRALSTPPPKEVYPLLEKLQRAVSLFSRLSESTNDDSSPTVPLSREKERVLERMQGLLQRARELQLLLALPVKSKSPAELMAPSAVTEKTTSSGKKRKRMANASTKKDWMRL